MHSAGIGRAGRGPAGGERSWRRTQHDRRVAHLDVCPKSAVGKRPSVRDDISDGAKRLELECVFGAVQNLSQLWGLNGEHQISIILPVLGSSQIGIRCSACLTQRNIGCSGTSCALDGRSQSCGVAAGNMHDITSCYMHAPFSLVAHFAVDEVCLLRSARQWFIVEVCGVQVLIWSVGPLNRRDAS